MGKSSLSELNVRVDGLEKSLDKHIAENSLQNEKDDRRMIKAENDIRIVQIESINRVNDALIKIAGLSAVLSIIVSLVMGVSVILLTRGLKGQ